MKIKIFFLMIALSALAVPAQKSAGFRSIEGGFEVDLPAKTDGSNQSGGLILTWRTADAEFDIGFRLRRLALRPGAEFSLDEFLRESFGRIAIPANIVSRTEIEVGGFPSVEYRLRTETSIILIRLIDASTRVFQVKAEIPVSRSGREQSVSAVMDSFRILTEGEIESERSRRIAAAMPKALPQSPVVPKPTTDAVDLDLKGRVKSVRTVYNTLDVRGAEVSQVRVDDVEFDESGAMLKKFEYLFANEVSSILVFGYIDGKRVARRGRVESETAISGIVVGKRIQAKFDPRYDEHYTYKYLGGKLVERSKFVGVTLLVARERYTYGKNRRQVEYFDGGSLPYSRVVFELDNDGLEQKVTVFERIGKTLKANNTQTIKYDSIDEQGNWTKRTFYKSYTFDGVERLVPDSAWIREITYY